MPFLSIQVIGNGGTTNPPPGDYLVAPDSTHTVTAIPYEGYAFDSFMVVGGPQRGGHTENPITVTVPDDITVLVYVFFRSAPPPPAPAHIVLQSYEWEFFPEGVFPYRLDDVRRAWRFVYTVKNVGGRAGEFELLIYLENAPPYIPRPIYGRLQPNVDAGQELTFEDVVLPETKGEEYYVLKLVSLETKTARLYTIGKTPQEAPTPTPEVEELATTTPPAPTTTMDELKKAAPLLMLALGLLAMAGKKE